VKLDPNHLIVAQGFELPHAAASPVGQSTWMSINEFFIVVGSGLAVAILLFVCVLVFKKRRADSRHHHHRHERSNRSSSTSNSEADEESKGSSHQHHRRRVRRRDHRPRNPTLAETGGLPPIKPNDPNPSAPI
jgi:hypothetical protein